jgi:hypothetical protein
MADVVLGLYNPKRPRQRKPIGGYLWCAYSR